jgi:hypothetical protein
MCDTHLVIFRAKKCKTQYRTSTNRIGRAVRYASCDFSGQEIQSRISHIDQPNGISREMCDTPLVIFLAKKYKTQYRTSTNRTASVELCDTHLVILWPRNTKPNIAHRPSCGPADQPNRIGRAVRYASCDFSGQEIQPPISHIDQPNGIGREMCDTHLVIFLAKKYKGIGRAVRHFGPCFQSTFRIREYFICATDLGFPKSSFGGHNIGRGRAARAGVGSW